MLGQSAHLGCDYSLANSSLYSVKWYKNGQEFFRFMPSMARIFEVFHVSGVNLDVSESSKQWKSKDKMIFPLSLCTVTTREFIWSISTKIVREFTGEMKHSWLLSLSLSL